MNSSPLSGRVVLVTGSTDGLGRELASELAGQGASVLLHGRDPRKGEQTLRSIRDSAGNEQLSFHLGDLSSLDQVRALAREIESEHERLDVLVNNAGVGSGPPRLLSQDGYELRFAVNYLAPFLLAHLLEPLLARSTAARSAPARIVNVSSAGQAPIDFDDVMLERHFSGSQAYGRSKLALIMLTFDLAARLEGRGVTANCLHPGTLMPTNMVREAGHSPIDSLETGVRSTLRLISDPALDGVSGRYFDRLREAQAHPQAYDADARRRLAELSVDLVGLAVSRMA